MGDRRWFNPVINFFDARNSWLGYFYVPTVQEAADKSHRELTHRLMRIEMAQSDKDKTLRTLERHIKSQWKLERREQARQSVRDLRRERVEFARLGRQKANVAAVTSKINELRAGTATEEALELYVTVMAERLETTHPRRFAHVIEQVHRVQSMQGMTDEMLAEFFTDEEQADRDRDAGDEDDEEATVTRVLVELGCLKGIEAAPVLCEVDTAKRGGDDDGGDGSGAAPKLLADPGPPPAAMNAPT